MKSLLKILALCAAAALLGAGSFALVMAFPPENTLASNGPWQTDLSVGSVQTGMYMRARVALMGLFALRKSEAVYFTARVDSLGGPLNSKCDYRIEGKDLPARWWSITAVGWNYYLIPNEANLYSFNMASVARRPDRSYIILLSPQKKYGNWLPSGSPHQGRLSLVLRLYLPAENVLKTPGSIELPRIIREGCR